MEILNFVVKFRKDHKNLFCILCSMLFLMAVTFFIWNVFFLQSLSKNANVLHHFTLLRNRVKLADNAFYHTFTVDTNNSHQFTFFGILTRVDVTAWLFFLTTALLGNIYIWFYYAPQFQAALFELTGAFKDKEQTGDGENSKDHTIRSYDKWCIEHQGWMKQFREKRATLGKTLVKIGYIVLWGGYIICVLIFLITHLFLVLPAPWSCSLIAIFSLVLICLNFSSYYNCACYVYFLSKICRLAEQDRLSYVEELPSTTYGFQVLSNTSRLIHLYFFLDSFLCTVAHISFLSIAFSKAGLNVGLNFQFISFIYLNAFMILFGLVSWIGIMLMSHAYLHRIHNSWRLHILQTLQERYNIITGNEEKEKIAFKMNTIVHDNLLVDRWQQIMAITTFLANLATAGITFDLFVNLS